MTSPAVIVCNRRESVLPRARDLFTVPRTAPEMAFWLENALSWLIRPVRAPAPESSGGRRGGSPMLRPRRRKRGAFMRLLVQSLPDASRFIAGFRGNARIASAHHASLAPNSPDRVCPPAKSELLVDLKAHGLPIAPDVAVRGAAL